LRPESGQEHLKWSLRVVEHWHGDVLVLELFGRVGAASAATFSEAVARGFGRVPRLVVDLAGVDYVSSAGLRALEVAARPGARNGGPPRTFVVCAVPEPVRIALDLAGLLSRLRIEGSRETAVARARG
jgi:anti-anti-sigma factor